MISEEDVPCEKRKKKNNIQGNYSFYREIRVFHPFWDDENKTNAYGAIRRRNNIILLSYDTPRMQMTANTHKCSHFIQRIIVQ